MKKLILILLFISQSIIAQTAFDRGNQLYQKGSYDKAILTYEAIEKSGVHSSELYFNLGNSYYKNNQVAPAIYYFEKALLLNPNDVSVLNNLSFAQKRTIDQIEELPKVGLVKLVQDFTTSFHYDSWAWITVVLSFVFFGCFLGYYFSNTTVLKRVFFSFMLLLILLIFVSLFVGFYEKDRFDNDKPAIVFTEMVSVKSEPNTLAKESFVLHAGTKVMVLETLNNYKKIQLLDLKEGWIEKNAIKQLK